MRVLIACEFSGEVRRAFNDRGHDAWSCDLLQSDDGSSRHIQDDVFNTLTQPWDMMIAFPPCTHLCSSGARWFVDKKYKQKEAIEFVRRLMSSNVGKIAIENPIGVLSTHIRKPDQIIQPWQFGHGETKATCLWLKNLPLLVPTNIVFGREQRIHRMPPSKDRGRMRSITYKGIAEAMAEQWGY